MRHYMTLYSGTLCLFALLLLQCGVSGVADAASTDSAAPPVSMGLDTRLSLDAGGPVLAAVVGGGERKLYVLIKGAIVTYDLPAGTVSGRFQVNPAFDGLERFPFSDTLVLTASDSGRVEIVQPYVQADFDNAGNPFLGTSDALVTVTIFAEYQCPNCAKFGPIYRDALQRFGEHLRVVFRYYPLAKHPQAVPAARAALAAHEQDAFAPYHKALYANQESLSPELYAQLAQELGLDVERFLKDFASPQTATIIEEDLRAASAAGVHKVPTIFVNGRLLTEWSQEGFLSLIREQLRKATQKTER